MPEHITLGNTAEPAGSRFNWVVYVRGATEFVQKVTIKLHPSFKKAVRVSEGPAFEFKSNGYGTFDINVIIEWKNKTELTRIWELQLDSPDKSVTISVPADVVSACSAGSDSAAGAAVRKTHCGSSASSSHDGCKSGASPASPKSKKKAKAKAAPPTSGAPPARASGGSEPSLDDMGSNALDLDGPGCAIPLTEERGITVAQLLGVAKHVKKYANTWTDTYEGRPGLPNEHHGKPFQADKVNLYQLAEHLIKAATAARRCSFVELIATAAQRPRWFVSHWWGEPVLAFVACVRSHATLRQAADQTPYWVCAYANNQWELHKEVVEDPRKTSFGKAMQIAEGTLSVIDAGAVCFTRIWCGFEVATALQNEDKFYDMVSLKLGSDEPVVITDGLAPEDKSLGEQYGPDWKGGARGHKSRREQDFPVHVVQTALTIKIEEGNASVAMDKTHILNSIAGARNLDEAPPLCHPCYRRTNSALHGRFAAALYPFALSRGDIETAELKPALMAFPCSKLSLSFHECDAMGNSELADLLRALPSEVQSLGLDCTGCVNLVSPLPTGHGIERLTALQNLDLQFARSPNLSDLSLLSSFRKLSSLTHLLLDFSMCHGLSDVSGLQSLGHLRSLTTLLLDLSACSDLDEEAAELALNSLPRLSTLAVDFSGSNLSMMYGDLRLPKSLTHLTLGASRCYKMLDLSIMQSCSGLEALQAFAFDGSSCSNLSDISALHGLGGLNMLSSLSIDLSRCEKIDQNHWRFDSVFDIQNNFKEIGTELTFDNTQPIGLKANNSNLVTSVTLGSQAKLKGVKVGWKIVEVDGKAAPNAARALKEALQFTKFADSLTIRFLTHGVRQAEFQARIFIGNTAQASPGREGRWDWVFYVRGDTQFIKSVTLHLHQSFKKPVRTLEEPFELKLNGWGTFAIEVIVSWKQGEGELRTTWELQFAADASKEFQIPRSALGKSSGRQSVSVASQVKALFRAADSNGDGMISLEELKNVCYVIAIGNSVDLDWERLFRACDVNNDGYLQYDEFIDWLFATESGALPALADSQSPSHGSRPAPVDIMI